MEASGQLHAAATIRSSPKYPLYKRLVSLKLLPKAIKRNITSLQQELGPGSLLEYKSTAIFKIFW
jgi:hypothetical protein